MTETHNTALHIYAPVAPRCRLRPGGDTGGAWAVEEGLEGAGARKGREGVTQVAVSMLQLLSAGRIRWIQPDSATEESAAFRAASAGS